MLAVMGGKGEGRQRVHSSAKGLTRMSQTISERLEYLRTANSTRPWINHDLYRLMYRPDLYILAYERIKSKPGNMTPGADGETLDGFSLDTIQAIIQDMRTERFRFKPV